MRIHENPALDVARFFAMELKLPLLVYQGLSERYDYASDRHHTFILEGARDVQLEAEAAGLCYAFHLERSQNRQPHLISLAKQAAVVITEDMPVNPPSKFLSSLLRMCDTPVVLVDTACVAPMNLVGQAYTRAFQFREATSSLYAHRLTRAWPDFEGNVDQFDKSQLPFPSMDLQNQSIASLVAACDIDHAIGPVRDTRGGSTTGYHRWRAFVNTGLRGYVKRRNDALTSGVSRMSAYLHYGMVSPFRIAREAATVKHEGAEKYLDELLIWRELAYAFCRFRSDHESWSALPEWAQQTLIVHQTDPRTAVYSWEALARAETSDELWNAAQLSLLRHGELHNNLRMTWGKAILQWTRTPQEALQLMIDLNHRYALDGRDPASYGGILWCLGQFDRPFQPEQPILGTVRGRPTSEHAVRLDVRRYQQKILQPRTPTSRRVAVIGAGISGAMAARTLHDHGVDVTIFEKSRGAGGRMATRRLDSGIAFDHGAQYFTARDLRFDRYCQSWLQQGWIARWPNPASEMAQRIAVFRQGRMASWSDGQERYVGVPSMNSVCKHLLCGIPQHYETRVQSIQHSEDRLILNNEGGESLGEFDRVVVSAPAPQTAQLLAGVSALAQPCEAITMRPCWAAMIELSKPLTDQWVGAFVHDSWVQWIARVTTKPGRGSNIEPLSQTEAIVVHASPDWTRKHFEFPADWVAQEALKELQRAISMDGLQPVASTAHRWNYAICPEERGQTDWFDSIAGIAVCGDWTHGSRVEGAFLSGMAAAGRIFGSFDEQPIPSRSSQQLLLFESS
jgi:photolyase PhrII